MTALIDTQLLLWAAKGSRQLPGAAEQVLVDRDVECVFSVVSIWEVVIKGAKDRPDFDVDPRQLRKYLLLNGYFELDVNVSHVLAVGDLPSLHKDPFDRLLVAQAKQEGLDLLTADTALAAYGHPVRVLT